MIKIGFVILAWNSQKCIGDCIASIHHLDKNAITGKTIVIDNGSTDDTVKVINEINKQYVSNSGFECSIKQLDRNYGTTYSRNIGLELLLGHNDIDYICILDSDTVVNTEALVKLVAALETDKHCGIIGPRMKDKNDIYQRSGRNIPTLTEKLFKVLPIKVLRDMGVQMESSVSENGTGCVQVGYLLSACWMMNKNTVRDVGFLDEKIFYAPEDVEYCIRCQKAGYTVKYCYDAEIIHEWQRLSRKKVFSKHNFEHIKGLAYMFMKHRYMFSTKKLVKSFERARKLVK